MIVTARSISASRILEMYPFRSEMYHLDHYFRMIIAHTHILVSTNSEMYPLDYPLDHHFRMIIAHTHILVSTNSEMIPLNYLFHEFIWISLTLEMAGALMICRSGETINPKSQGGLLAAGFTIIGIALILRLVSVSAGFVLGLAIAVSFKVDDDKYHEWYSRSCTVH
jgi:hypothetical protein